MRTISIFVCVGVMYSGEYDVSEYIIEVCKSNPKPIRSDSFGFRNQNIHFGSDRIDKVVS